MSGEVEAGWPSVFAYRVAWLSRLRDSWLEESRPVGNTMGLSADGVVAEGRTCTCTVATT